MTNARCGTAVPLMRLLLSLQPNACMWAPTLLWPWLVTLVLIACHTCAHAGRTCVSGCHNCGHGRGDSRLAPNSDTSAFFSRKAISGVAKIPWSTVALLVYPGRTSACAAHALVTLGGRLCKALARLFVTLYDPYDCCSQTLASCQVGDDRQEALVVFGTCGLHRADQLEGTCQLDPGMHDVGLSVWVCRFRVACSHSTFLHIDNINAPPNVRAPPRTFCTVIWCGPGCTGVCRPQALWLESSFS